MGDTKNSLLSSLEGGWDTNQRNKQNKPCLWKPPDHMVEEG